MKDFKELNRLVVATLEVRKQAKAFEIYQEVSIQKPLLVRRGFKSFVKVMSSFPEVVPKCEKHHLTVYTIKK